MSTIGWHLGQALIKLRIEDSVQLKPVSGRRIKWSEHKWAIEKPTLRVYFIQAGEGGPIKIGRSVHPMKRLLSLQTGASEPLSLLATIPAAGPRLEKELHREFAHLRLYGEWFAPGEDLINFIYGRRKGGSGNEDDSTDSSVPTRACCL